MTRAEQYQGNIGNKFHADGSVRSFAGNTVISFIDHADPIFALFCRVRSMLQATSAGDCFTYLPDDSIHMTVFEGVCDQWRDASLWTHFLPVDCPLTEVDKLFEQRFRLAPVWKEVYMHAVGIKTDGGYGIALEPASAEDASRLRTYRDALRELLGIEFPGHDTYRYHISICYGVKSPTAAQETALDRFEKDAEHVIAQSNATFRVNAPHLTYFRNMFGFETERFARS